MFCDGLPFDLGCQYCFRRCKPPAVSCAGEEDAMRLHGNIRLSGQHGPWFPEALVCRPEVPVALTAPQDVSCPRKDSSIQWSHDKLHRIVQYCNELNSHFFVLGRM